MVKRNRLSVSVAPVRSGVTIFPTPRSGGGDASVWLRGKKGIVLKPYSPKGLDYLVELLTFPVYQYFK